VKCGAGLKLRAECFMGHRTSIQTCEFLNQGRTSAIDVRISVLQLVIGISMSQECLFGSTEIIYWDFISNLKIY
jgi:hypothetical protein